MFTYACNTNYIQAHRLALDQHFPPTYYEPYELSFLVSINCSKPEIIAGDNSSNAPPVAPLNSAPAKCAICFENSHSKPGLRVFQLSVNQRPFFVQLPPYPYFENHHVVIEQQHVPQIITDSTIVDLLDYSLKFPNVYIASNTDLEGTGASILSHRHYQAGTFRYPIFDAKALFETFCSATNVWVQILKYPCFCVKIQSPVHQNIIPIVNSILAFWREKSCEISPLEIISSSQTMSFVSVFSKDTCAYEIIMIPINSRRRTRDNLKYLKREFVGVIEMSGLAILPGRISKLTQFIASNLKSNHLDLSPQKQLPEWQEALPFLSTYVLPNLASDSSASRDSSVPHIIQTSLSDAFLDIIRDNSGIDEQHIPLLSSHLFQHLQHSPL